jgi:hypothetical protein
MRNGLYMKNTFLSDVWEATDPRLRSLERPPLNPKKMFFFWNKSRTGPFGVSSCVTVA